MENHQGTRTRMRPLTLRQMEKYALLSPRPRRNSSNYRKRILKRWQTAIEIKPKTHPWQRNRQEWTCWSQFERTLEDTAHKTTPFIVLRIVRRTTQKYNSRHASGQLTSVHAQQKRSILQNLHNVLYNSDEWWSDWSTPYDLHTKRAQFRTIRPSSTAQIDQRIPLRKAKQ